MSEPPSGNIWQLIEWRAAQTPDARMVMDDAGRELGFGAYRDAAERAAAGLAARGVGEGSAVSWMLPTRPVSLVLMGALARLGAVQNPIIPIYRHREVDFVTRQTGARLLVVPPRFRNFDYQGMARELAVGREGLDALVVDHELPEGDPASLPPPPPPVAPEDAPVRWVYYTSGTTADPKGAKHTDATVSAAGAGMARVLDLRPGEKVALPFPITHIGGVCWLVAGLVSGATQLFIEIFDPATSIDLIARLGVEHAGAGTVIHQAFLAAQRERGGPPIFPKVRTFFGGGAPKPPQLHYDLKREIGGVGIVSGYGLTECPIIAMNTVSDPDEKLAYTEGRVNPPEAEIRVVKSDETRAAPGEEGELRVRGPQLCRGYLDAALDADAFDAEGFFRTGDLGKLDAEGFVTITGRLKDVIIRKGENISAKEVEDLLYTHPKVADVAVIGLPDPGLGERCCAVVQCQRRDDPLRFDEMVSFLKDQKLMMQKIPEQLELVDEVPRNPAGKILKADLRKRYAPAG